MDPRRKRGREKEPESKKSHKKAKSGQTQEAQLPIHPSPMTAVIKKAMEALEPDMFLHIMTTILLPAAESALTQEAKDGITDVFQAALGQENITNDKQKGRAIELIDFSNRSSSLYKSVSMLEGSTRVYDNDDNQTEMLEEAAIEMVEWLNILFKVGIEMKVQFSLVGESLSCMLSVMSEMSNLSIPFDGDVFGHDKVKSSGGSVRYKSNSLGALIFKLWRDLLLVAISQGDSDKFVKTTIAAFDREDLNNLKKWVMPKEQNSLGYEAMDNEWHTPEMVASLPRLQKLLSARGKSSR